MTTQTPSVSNQASASSTTPPPVSFTSLPYELRQSIVLLACTPSRPWHVSIDVDLALNLMLAHSATYGPTAPLLYRNVRITKASQLVEFARALVAKPSLGAMVRGLHLGPDCLLPGDYWPLTNEKTIKSSLRGAESVPRWWQQWVALSPTYTSMRLDQVGDAMFPCAKAVWQAMEEAQVALGIDLQRPRLAPDGQTVAPTRGFMGVLEVQAALDLYLIELRRLEDQREASAARNGYGNSHVIGPPLAIKLGAPTEAVDPAPQGIFTLHHSALIEHLARRGAAMDHFEHPYRLLKSGLEVVRLDDDGIGRPSNSFIERLKGLNSDAAIEDFAQQHMLGPSPTALHSTLPASSTTGGILELARQVLAQAPQIEHLSLGSYFQLLLWRDGVGLPASLRSLCLGPLSEFHDMSLCPSLQLQGDPFTGLEKLHISGHVGWERKVVLIANLPRLKEAVWDIKLANFDLPYDEGARAVTGCIQHAVLHLDLPSFLRTGSPMRSLCSSTPSPPQRASSAPHVAWTSGRTQATLSTS